MRDTVQRGFIGFILGLYGAFTRIRVRGFPKIWGTFFRAPIIRVIIYWDLYWGPLIFGMLPIRI